jgi:glycine/D-amino acid oxidase-like deaminating enzyme
MTRSRADVLVIGGGIVGMSCAYWLQKSGVSVIVVEREHLAFGASGRNAGFIWLSLRAGGSQLALAKAGLALYPEIADDIGNSFEFRKNGGLIYCFTEDQLRVLEELATRRRQDGLPMEIVSGAHARELCPILPEKVLGATFCPEDGQLHSEKFVRALGTAFRGRGGDVLEGTGVVAIRHKSGRVTGVETTSGPVEADTIVLATGAWSAPLMREVGIDLPVRPMRLQAMSTVPIEQRFDRVLYGPLALKQYNLIRELPSYRDDIFRSPSEASLSNVELCECFSQRYDGSVLMGCAMDYPGYVDTTTLEGIGITAKVLSEHIPSLRDVPLEKAWACLLPYTPDSMPYIGRHPELDGLMVAAGHVFGNSSGPATGELISRLFNSGPIAFDMTAVEVARHRGMDLGVDVRW